VLCFSFIDADLDSDTKFSSILVADLVPLAVFS